MRSRCDPWHVVVGRLLLVEQHHVKALMRPIVCWVLKLQN